MRVRSLFMLALWLMGTVAVLPAAPALHLKSGRAPQVKLRAKRLFATTPTASQSHLIVQFADPPGQPEIEELRKRGGRVLDYVPDNGLMVAAPPGLSLDGLPIAWSGVLLLTDKLSKQLEYASGMNAIVEFHRDTAPDEMRTLATAAGLSVVENADLLGYQLLVKGDPEGVWRLAEADEAAYVYPASVDLARNRRVHPCMGSLTAAGNVGQYSARVSDGWDGPGRRGASVGFAFTSFTMDIPPQDIRAAVARAMNQWAQQVEVTFTESTDRLAAATIEILFARMEHGDTYSFDGPGSTLAHTFYPAPPNAEPIAGDMHLDVDEDWHVGEDIDLYSVVLHELGHSLGLAHSDSPSSVMYPFYQRTTVLSQDDIDAILELYAGRGSEGEAEPLTLSIQNPGTATVTTYESSVSMSGSVSGGTGAVTLRWSVNDLVRGESQIAPGSGSRPWALGPVELGIGTNEVVIQATDSAAASFACAVKVTRLSQTPAIPPAPVAPRLAITSPAGPVWRTTSGTTILNGTAWHQKGIQKVEWRSSRGAAGAAAGTTNWSTGSLALEQGTTVFTVTASSTVGTSAVVSVEVEYVPSSAADILAPTLAIDAPASTAVSTSAATITLRGRAQDDLGVVEVTWRTSGGAAGTAPGSTFWGPVEVPLLQGTNTITIRARDAAGNTGWRSVVVTRY